MRVSGISWSSDVGYESDGDFGLLICQGAVVPALQMDRRDGRPKQDEWKGKLNRIDNFRWDGMTLPRHVSSELPLFPAVHTFRVITSTAGSVWIGGKNLAKIQCASETLKIDFDWTKIRSDGNCDVQKQF